MSSNRFTAIVWMLGLSMSWGGLSAQEHAAEPALKPQIATLVAQLENPADPDAREKGLDGLLALGEPGIAVLRDRLSCKDAKLQIEVTPGRVVAAIGQPCRIEARLRNIGTGLLWVVEKPEEQYFEFSASKPGTFGFQREFQGGVEFEARGVGDRKGIYVNPIRAWKPVRPGETLAKAVYEVPPVKLSGVVTLTVRALLTQHMHVVRKLPCPIHPRIPGTEQNVQILVGDPDWAERVDWEQHATVLVRPDLKQTPADPRAKIEIEPKKAVLAAHDSHLACTFRLRNTQPQQQILVEQNFVRYAWCAWINRDGVPVDWSAWIVNIREHAYQFRPAVLLSPGAAFECTLHVRRPKEPGEYRLLAGYEMPVPDDFEGPFVEPLEFAPPITAPYGTDDTGKLLSACKTYALSPPLSIPHPFKSDLPPPRDGEPEAPLADCYFSAEEAQARWKDALNDAQGLYTREAWIADELSALQSLAPALLYARTLKVNDERKAMIYYHCGQALVRQRESTFRHFETPYTYFCVRQACELTHEFLRPDDHLRIAALLLHARFLTREHDLEPAARALNRVQAVLESVRDSLPWEWVHYLSARMKILSGQDHRREAIELYKTQVPWLNQALGPHSDGLSEISCLAQEIALNFDAAYAAQLEQNIARLNEARKAIGDPSRGSLDACKAQVRHALAMGKAEQAEQLLIQACILARYISHSPYYEVDAIRALYLYYRNAEQFEKALPLARRLLAEAECAVDRSALDLARAKANLGVVLFRLGKKVESAVHIRHAISCYEKAGQGSSPETDLLRSVLEKLK